jgi:hypothetical protein
MADFPLPDAAAELAAFAPCLLNMGAFFNMSGSIRKRIFDPRM